jgi:hypothetical protein
MILRAVFSTLGEETENTQLIGHSHAEYNDKSSYPPDGPARGLT